MHSVISAQAEIQKKSVSTSKFVFCNTLSMHSHAGAWERGRNDFRLLRHPLYRWTLLPLASQLLNN